MFCEKELRKLLLEDRLGKQTLNPNEVPKFSF